MTQDFAKRKSRNTDKPPKKLQRKTQKIHKKHKDPCKPAWWLWALTLLGIALFVVFLKKISQTTPSKGELPITDIPAELTSNVTPEIELDFYRILKEHEVTVDAEPILDPREDATTVYWLQAASFKSYEEADILRARLLLLNLEAVIEKTTNRQQNWYRVLVGSFNSRSKMAKARSILASIEIKSLIIKRNVKP